MVGKRVQLDEETWSAIDLLRRERGRSFQQLADEAFRDLLDKHGHPTDLRTQLRGSVDKPRAKSRKSGAAASDLPMPSGPATDVVDQMDAAIDKHEKAKKKRAKP